MLADDVLSQINDNHNNTNGKCGLPPLTIAANLNKPYSEIRPVLNALNSSNKILVRQGINSLLVFKAINT